MRLSILSVVIAAWLPLQAMAQTATMDCTAGPISKSFGGSKWLVSSCSDNRTIILMAMNDSPALRPSPRTSAALSQDENYPVQYY